jgi:hypothetical protein
MLVHRRWKVAAQVPVWAGMLLVVPGNVHAQGAQRHASLKLTASCHHVLGAARRATSGGCNWKGPVVVCGSASGKKASIHLSGRYGSSKNPYHATSMYETTNLIPSTFAYSPKAVFPETQLLSYALTVLVALRPRFRRERFYTNTVTPAHGKVATLGTSQYRVGGQDGTPMTRPTPCR